MYITSDGDTYELISRSVYGTPDDANRIRNANPGVTEPLTAGISLYIPPNTEAPQDQPHGMPSTGIDETAIRVNGKRFRFWSEVMITRSIDSIDTISLSAPFEPDDVDIRAAFVPMAFNPVDVTIGGNLLFTGTMVEPMPELANDSRTVTADCYALPGVLSDCTAPASAYPLEFNGQTLEQISIKICDYFGIRAVFDSDVGPVFDRVALNPGDKVLPFLSKLAKQRGLLISSTPEGALRFFKPSASQKPVAVLEHGVSPVLSVTPNFRSQDFYTSITGIEPVLIGLNGAQHTIRVTAGNRPYTFEVSDTEGGDVKTAVEAKVGQMLANAVSYSVPVATMRDPQGDLWEPGAIVKLTAPGAMIYESYLFMIRSVTFRRNDNGGGSAVLNLIIPESFTGGLPERMPWD